MLLHLPKRGTTQGLTPGRNLLEFFFKTREIRKVVKKEVLGASLAVQWLKICLAMQRT